MAGGTWTSQNKVRPGVYIRFKTAKASGLNVGTRGVVAFAKAISWGPVGVVTEIEAGQDVTPITGYDITSEKNRWLNEMFKGTNRTNGPVKILFYRLSGAGAEQAAGAIGDLNFSAKYPGARGNDITVIVTEEVDNTFTVSTAVDGEIVDTQIGITAISDLRENNWVTWSGTGDITANTGVTLTGGADGTVSTAAYSTFLSAIEPYKFDVLAYDGSDATVLDAMSAFVKRIADESGAYTQLVASGFATGPDSRFIVDVESGVTLGDGTQLTASQTVWWAAGALAGATYNQSLTYATYPGAVAVSPVLTNSDTIDALNKGQFVLFAENGTVKVEQDINSLVTYTEDIGKVYRKNRVIRLCNTIANDLYQQFAQGFIGVVNNNEQGRSRFKAVVVGYLLDIQANQGIQNFDVADVDIQPGEDIDAIVITIAIQAVDATEKIYMTIEVS